MCIYIYNPTFILSTFSINSEAFDSEFLEIVSCYYKYDVCRTYIYDGTTKRYNKKYTIFINKKK